MKELTNDLQAMVISLADVLTVADSAELHEISDRILEDMKLPPVSADTPRPLFADTATWHNYLRQGDLKDVAEEELIARAEAANKAYLENIADCLFNLDCEPLPGIEPLFEQLRDRNIKVIVNSPLPRRHTNILLYKLKWDRDIDHLFRANGPEARVDLVVAPDSRRRTRPYPDLLYMAQGVLRLENVDRMLFISSDDIDWQMADNLGCRSYKLQPGITLVDQVNPTGTTSTNA